MVTRFGKYLLLKRIAMGGMAELFLARQQGVEGFEKLVVVKRILEHYAADRDFVEMFLNEARLAASLSHPNIVQSFDLGEEGGVYFIAMEFVPGHDLFNVARKCTAQERPIPAPVAARIIADACAGLHYAHTRKSRQGQPLNIVHRDVSPANIIISYEGAVKLVDFGIAKAASHQARTRAGMVKGKYSYMSPEQIQGLPLDGRSDVFALGITLHESLVGRRLFKREAELAIMNDILHGEVVPPSTLRPDLPPALERICLKALEKDRDRRYPSAREMQLDLERYIASCGEPATAIEVSAFLLSLFQEEHGAYQQLLARLDTTDPAKLAMFLEENSAVARNRSEGSASGPSIRPDEAGLPPAVRHRGGRGLQVALAAAVVLLVAVSAVLAVLWSSARRPVEPIRVKTPPVSLVPPAPPPDPAPATAPPPEPEPVEPVAEEPAEKPLAPARAPVRGTGVLELSSEPPVEVFFQGKRLGETPVQLKLPVGRVELRLVDRKVALSRTVEVEVPARGPGRQTITFQKGKLAADVTPWADLYLGDRKLGTTPLAPRELYQGTYQVKLVNSEIGAIKEVTVQVEPGRTTVLRETLP
jgi:serine/threonine-protein kinase